MSPEVWEAIRVELEAYAPAHELPEPSEINPMTPTFCRDCDLVHSATREKEPYRWRCMARPVAPNGGFVDPDWRPDPPYELCHRVNDGTCSSFTPLRRPDDRKAA